MKAEDVSQFLDCLYCRFRVISHICHEAGQTLNLQTLAVNPERSSCVNEGTLLCVSLFLRADTVSVKSS